MTKQDIKRSKNDITDGISPCTIVFTIMLVMTLGLVLEYLSKV